jgi:hypothetical protein
VSGSGILGLGPSFYMNQPDWLAQVLVHREVLREIVETYHPYNGPHPQRATLKITAPSAEARMVGIREEIAMKSPILAPAVRFDAAIADKNFHELYLILSATWFGVPESTECWGIRGFKELVALLEDMPEPNDEELAEMENES